MREIKFRAWYNGRMYAVNQIIWYSETNIVCGLTKPQVPGSQIWVGTTEAEVQEYTGLKDKAGKEIYEGDIVHYDYSYPKDKPFVVKFDTQEFVDSDYQAFCIGYNLDPTATEHYTIIGNIYENPDLLEAQP